MSNIRVGIVGAAGYTGGELVRILLHHPHVQIGFVHSTSHAGMPVQTVHRDLVGDTDLHFTDQYDDRSIDFLFMCSGHGKSKQFLEQNPVRADVRIIDLSQDFRIIGTSLPRPFIYGLPEADTKGVASAANIANPGCFATCIQLGLLPMAKSGLLTADIHISAITGSTGAGQKPSATSHFSWRNNNISVYKAFTHQHLAEIRQSLCNWQPGFDSEINFIPYRGNFTRGILASIYLDTGLRLSEISALFKDYYEPHPFVHVINSGIDLKQVVNTNKCLIFIEKHKDKLLLTSAIDNLLKGAAGQAVQNMNLMCGLEDTVGLRFKATAF
jgi:N-acetyl-gamma-glutamyl-phosphate reductase